jgi:HK97 family phage portal protein
MAGLLIRLGLAAERVERDVDPIEGTNISLWNDFSSIPAWWSQMGGAGGWLVSPQMADRIWVANRCIHLNARQIARMPLRFSGPGTNPEWLSVPDPDWYSNSLGDALYAVVAALYGWGFALLYGTSDYADGFARTWTVLPPHLASVTLRDGERVYKVGEEEYDPDRIVQIDRDPGARLHGSPALSAYGQQAWGLQAAGNQALAFQSGGVPQAVLKSEKKINAEQAADIQAKWMTAAANRAGQPPVMGPDLSFETLSFNPSDLALLETQEFEARVIASAYGVPAFLLNLPLQGGLTYQNPAMLGEMWWRFELRPTATQIADALSTHYLPRGQYVWFEASDTFAPLAGQATEQDDPQAAANKEPNAPTQTTPAAAPTPLRPVSTNTGG